MHKRELPFASIEALDTATLEKYAEGWLLDCEIRQHTRATVELRRIILARLVWFLKDGEHPSCGLPELRLFLRYLAKGHEAPGGRWGQDRYYQAVRPQTVQTYHRHLKTFFSWLIAEGVLTDSPMERLAAPVARPDQIQPFSLEQVEALLLAAKRSTHPKRDEAILSLLLDTGLRASELCSLTLASLDLQAKRLTVLGKGNKLRTVYFGRSTARSLWNYLREDPREPTDPLFVADRGTGSGEGLTRSGLLQLMERLGEKAKLQAVRCSPHTLRHTFAVTFLRNGGNTFTLQQLLGHTSLAMTNRYVALAEADLERQHRLFSPMDALKGEKDRRR